MAGLGGYAGTCQPGAAGADRRAAECRGPVELDALARRRNVVLLDPEGKRLERAYVHVPAYINGPAHVIENALSMKRRGFAIPDRVPLEFEIHYYF